MKTFSKVIAGALVVLALLAGAFFYFNYGFTSRAEGFLAALKRKDMAAARTFLSADLAAGTDDAALRDFFSRDGLLNYREAHWTQRRVDTGLGEAHSTLTTESGAQVPLTLEFVREQDSWKIRSIQRALSGLLPDTLAPVPPQAAQTALARQSMNDFANAVQKQSLELFRATTSQAWQKQYSPAQFNDSYRSAIPLKPFFEGLEALSPDITPATKLGSNGRMEIAGSYPRGQSRLYFDATYIYESGSWKLLAFGFRLQ